MFELAIYGGTFAPVHNGHIHAARAFFNAVKPDRLLIIPTLIPPHKQLDFADDPKDRLNMLRLAFENEPEYGKKLFISDYELSAPPPSYTVNTLRHFAKEGQRITFLVGTDMLLTLDKWREASEIFKLCRIAFMRRESNDSEYLSQIDEKLNVYRNKYNADILVINEDPIEISSSDIRSGSAQTRKKYLPKAVLDYIEANGIYKQNATVTEEDLIRLRGELNKFISGKRLSHSLAVEEEVTSLAGLFGLSVNDSNRLRAAAILHDITKELSVDGHLELCKKHSLEVTEDDLKSPKVFHSLTGAYEAMELYPEIIDRETFNAIKYHTTGRAGLTLFDKLLYLADYIEKTRTFPDCVKLREYFYSKPASVGHLDKTLLISFDMTLKNLEDEGQFVHPSTLIARNAIAKEIT